MSSVRNLPSAVIIEVSEQVLKSTRGDDFGRVLDDAIKLGKDVGLNFSKTRYINSASISGLALACKNLAKFGKRLFIIAPTAEVSNILYVTGIERVIESVASEAEFLELAGKP